MVSLNTCVQAPQTYRCKAALGRRGPEISVGAKGMQCGLARQRLVDRAADSWQSRKETQEAIDARSRDQLRCPRQQV